jgi:hypothetical protein
MTEFDTNEGVSANQKKSRKKFREFKLLEKHKRDNNAPRTGWMEKMFCLGSHGEQNI